MANAVEYLLGFYIWNTQSSQVFSFAPWISPSSINSNIDIGGGGETLWYNFPNNGIYPVTFTQTGLSGHAWAVTLNGAVGASQGTNVLITETNGTYSYTIPEVGGYTANPSSGTITVDGAAVTVPITWAIVPATYAVTFTQTGLPVGATWSVAINGGVPVASTASTISFNEMNGSYAFAVATSTPFYFPSPSVGSITVNGAAVATPIAFTYVAPTLDTVTFLETGLGLGATWSATVAGVTNTSSGTSLSVTVTNPGGLTYAYYVSATGYTASPSGGLANFTSGSFTVTVTFRTVTG
ncbi:hypothetical protein B1B_17732, partial [mine drainage metagenome]